MNTDIRLSVSFKGHRKRKKFKMLLDHPSATDFLIDLWITVAVDRPDGSLAGLDSLDICLMAGWEGDCTHFVEALTAAGFIDKTEKGYEIHEWVEHNGYASGAKLRSAAAQKAAKLRWNKRLKIKEECDSNAPAMPPHEKGNAPYPYPYPYPSPLPIPSLKDIETPTKEKRKAPRIFSFSDIVALGVDEETARDFILHRKNKKAPLTKTAWDGIASEISKANMTITDGISMMMTMGWTGFKSTWEAVQLSKMPQKMRASAPKMSARQSYMREIGDICKQMDEEENGNNIDTGAESVNLLPASLS